MAYRTNYNPNRLDLFKNRLLELMISHNVTSAKKLASALYENNLVTVNSSVSFTNPNKVKFNAISSIEKKIQKHLQTNSPCDIQGEFIIAYSCFFNCSTDYITCKTDIKSTSFEIREICEKTGLSEKAVTKIKQGGRFISYSELLSKLIESEHFNSFMESVNNLDESYNQPPKKNPFLKQLDVQYDLSIKNCALDLINCSADELSAINPSADILDALYLYKQAMDYNYESDIATEFKEKVLRYDLQTAFTLLINTLYPIN